MSRGCVAALRWSARVLATALFLLWGAFFVEHVGEWFVRPAAWPPLRVVGIVALHGVMLAGLLLGWWRERLGAVVTAAGAVAFFTACGGKSAPLFIAGTSLPALLWWISADRKLSARSTPDAPPGPPSPPPPPSAPAADPSRAP